MDHYYYGGSSIFPIHFSHRDLKKVFVKALNQSCEYKLWIKPTSYEGDSQHYKL